MTTVSDDFKALFELRTHCWAYFEYHARQRTQMFNYFILSSGVFANAISMLIRDEQFFIGCLFSTFAAATAIIFTLLDLRNKSLVRTAEAALYSIENELMSVAAIPNLITPFINEVARDEQRSWIPRVVVKHGFLVEGFNLAAAIGFTFLAGYLASKALGENPLC